jgi:hypothetical protein
VIGISESDQSIPFRRKRSYRRRSEGEAGTNRNLYLSLAHGWIIRQLTVRAVATPSRRAGDTNQPVDVNEPLLPNKPTNNLPTRTSFGPLVVSETSVYPRPKRSKVPWFAQATEHAYNTTVVGSYHGSFVTRFCGRRATGSFGFFARCGTFETNRGRGYFYRHGFVPLDYR